MEKPSHCTGPMGDYICTCTVCAMGMGRWLYGISSIHKLSLSLSSSLPLPSPFPFLPSLLPPLPSLFSLITYSLPGTTVVTGAELRPILNKQLVYLSGKLPSYSLSKTNANN